MATLFIAVRATATRPVSSERMGKTFCRISVVILFLPQLTPGRLVLSEHRSTGRSTCFWGWVSSFRRTDFNSYDACGQFQSVSRQIECLFLVKGDTLCIARRRGSNNAVGSGGMVLGVCVQHAQPSGNAGAGWRRMCLNFRRRQKVGRVNNWLIPSVRNLSDWSIRQNQKAAPNGAAF